MPFFESSGAGVLVGGVRVRNLDLQGFVLPSLVRSEFCSPEMVSRVSRQRLHRVVGVVGEVDLK